MGNTGGISGTPAVSPRDGENCRTSESACPCCVPRDNLQKEAHLWTQPNGLGGDLWPVSRGQIPLVSGGPDSPVTIKCGHHFGQSRMGRSARQVLLSCLLTPMPRGEPQKQCPAWGGMIGITQEFHIRKNNHKIKRQETRTGGEKHHGVSTLFFGDSLQLLCDQRICQL